MPQSSPDWWTLRDLLAAALATRAASVEVLSRAGINLALVSLEAPSAERWSSALEVAFRSARLDALFDVLLADPNIRAHHAELRALRAGLAAPAPAPAPAPASAAKTGAPELLFSWVHLSDLHALQGGPGVVHDQDFVLTALAADLRSAVATEGYPAPRALFFTGDVATRGGALAGEYDRAAQHLRALAKAAGCPEDRVFVVPGNHDVRRSTALLEKAVVDQIRDGALDVDDALADDGARGLLEKRLAGYLAFARALRPGLATLGSWTETLHGDELSVRVVGLDTALLANDDGDRGKLRLGKGQLQHLVDAPREGELVLALSHHPATDGWLADESTAGVRIRTRAHVHLSGHVHEQGALAKVIGGGSPHVAITAGAAHGDADQHGYNFVAVVRTDRGVELRAYPRRWSTRQQRFVAEVDLTLPGRPYAAFTLGVSLATDPSGPQSEGIVRPNVPRPPSLVVTPSQYDAAVRGGGRAPKEFFQVTDAAGRPLDFEVEPLVDWVVVEKASGAFKLTPKELPPGTHAGTVVVQSHAGAVFRLSVRLVVAPPELRVRPARLDLGDVRVGEARLERLAVEHAGDDWTVGVEGRAVTATRVRDDVVVRVQTDAPRTIGAQVVVSAGPRQIRVPVVAEIRPPSAPPPAPTPAPPLPPAPTAPTTTGPSVPVLDIAGRWSSLTGAMVFLGTPLTGYVYQELNTLGQVVGEGQARLVGAMVQLQGTNLLAGPVIGELAVQGSRLAGVISVPQLGVVQPIELLRG